MSIYYGSEPYLNIKKNVVRITDTSFNYGSTTMLTILLCYSLLCRNRWGAPSFLLCLLEWIHAHAQEREQNRYLLFFTVEESSNRHYETYKVPVLGFFSSRPNWDPHHLTRRRVCSPPFGSGGGTLACGRVGGGSQIGRGDRHSYSRFMCTLSWNRYQTSLFGWLAFHSHYT